VARGNTKTTAVLNNFVSEVNARYGRGDLSLSSSDWVVKYTKLKGVHYSFLDHEFQKAIIDDPNPQVIVKKCAQVGLSEVMVRQIVSFLARNQGLTAIITQPTRKNALDFSTTRIDDILKESPLLHAMLDSQVDSKELKKLGKSYMYIKGTIGAKSAISVPADMLIHDELDFSDLDIINKYSSRVQHSKYKIFKKFSTPTIPNFGISKEFDVSDQKHYMMKCKHCGHWGIPSFFNDVVVDNPAFADKPLELITHDDLAYIQPSQVHTLCPNCRRPVTYHDYTKMEWVATYPGRAISGYQVSPFNTPFQDPYSLIKMMNTYTRYADFVNFSLGMDYVDASAIFDTSRFQQAALGIAHSYGLFMGIDFGKKCWIVIGQKNLRGETLIYKAESVSEEQIISKVVEYTRAYHIAGLCVDALPQTKLSREVCEAADCPAYTVYYSDIQKDLYNIKANEIDVTVNRTQLFDTILGIPKLVVDDKIDDKQYLNHLQGMVKQRDLEDEHKYRYVKVKDDHLLHATGYMALAETIFGNSSKKFAMPTIDTTIFQ
jgi:hypothetical protein